MLREVSLHPQVCKETLSLIPHWNAMLYLEVGPLLSMTQKSHGALCNEQLSKDERSC